MGEIVCNSKRRTGRKGCIREREEETVRQRYMRESV